MSATFWCHEAPRTKVEKPCDFHGCVPGDRCGYCEDGVLRDTVSESPSFNLNNGNTASICRVLGLDNEDGAGQVAVGDIPEVRKAIVSALNRSGQRATGVRESEDYRAPVHTHVVNDGNVATIERRGGCRVIGGGLDDEGLCYRLRLLNKLLAYGQEHNYLVSWG